MCPESHRTSLRQFFAWGMAFFFVLIPMLRADDQTPYSPLDVPPGFASKPLDLNVADEGRHRNLPVRIFLPPSTSPSAVVLFSHGLGGSREGDAFLGMHWAARGYVAVFLQHPGSDSAVWQDKPVAERLIALTQAADEKNFLLRIGDVRVVLDRLEEWNTAGDSPLKGRLDLRLVAMSGHSFGAITAQAVGGQSFPLVNQSLTDKRIRAVILFSPSSPRLGDPRQAFSDVRIPWMLMTGTKDVTLIGQVDVQSRLAVFSALPPGGKYEVVLDAAEHSAFIDCALPGDTEPRNPNHHRVMLALSTAFLDAWLRNDPAARSWMDGSGPAAILQEKDTWRKK